MKIFIFICAIVLLASKETTGGADHDVERVRSPYVDPRDLGPLMSVNNNGKGVLNDLPIGEPYVPFNAYPAYGQQKRICTTCQYGTSSSSSSLSSATAMGGIPQSGHSYGSSGSYGYIEPGAPVHASSRHEVKKEQEFINGQKVYDFHHEKRYKDGKLIDEQRHEIAPDELGTQPGLQKPGLGSSHNQYDTSSSSNTLISTHKAFDAHTPYYGASIPSPAISNERENRFQGVSNARNSVDNSHLYENQFKDEFQSEIDRLHEEMRKKTLSLSHATRPVYGGSHKTEYSTQTKYVNGRPIYIRNEERKYKDGKLVHNVTDEKGPEDFGTADLTLNTPLHTSPTGGVYSSNKEIVSKLSQIPALYGTQYPGSYPYYSSNDNAAGNIYKSSLSAEDTLTSAYFPRSSVPIRHSIESASSQHAQTLYPQNQKTSYSALPVHSPDIPEYRQQAHTSSSHQTNIYGTTYGEGREINKTPYQPAVYESSQYDNYGSSSRHVERIPTTTTTSTTTTPILRYKTDNYSPTDNHGSQYAHHSRPINVRYQNNYEDPVSSRQLYNPPKPHYHGFTGISYKVKEENAYDDSRYQPYNPVIHVSTEPTPSMPIAKAGEPQEDRYVRPSSSKTFSQTDDKIREVSQSSYYEANPNRRIPDKYPSYIQSTNHVQKVNQDHTGDKYNSNSLAASSFTETQENDIYRTPSQTKRVSQTSSSYPGARVASSSTQEESKRIISSGYYSKLHETPEIEASQVSQDGYGYRGDDDYDDEEDAHTTRHPQITTSTRRPLIVMPTRRSEHFSRPDYYKYPGYTHNQVETDQRTPNAGVPGVINGPMTDQQLENDGEQERYDISPYDDENPDLKPENEFEINAFPSENLPKHKPDQVPYDQSFGSSKSHSYEGSRRHETEQSKHYGLPKRVLNADQSIRNQQNGYSVVNSSRTDHRTTTVLPSRWVDTKTTWKYVNGILSSETQYHRYYENGILIHENSTQRTRDQMAADGINVLNLDLTSTELAQYGPAITSSTHTQKHEVHQIKRFRDGQQIYELNQERLFQDGDLVHEKKDEKDEDDFETLVSTDNMNINHQLTQSQHLNQHAITAGSGFNTGYSVNPKTYVRRHELRQEEEFVNGQKVYDLHHEKEFHDGALIRENKTELGPQDLQHVQVAHEDALTNILTGKSYDSLSQEAIRRQKLDSDKVLTTSCITCGTHGRSESSSSFTQMNTDHSKGILGSLVIPNDHIHGGDGSSFRHDINVEEHYENGKLVKGREEHKKWKDGQLIDSDHETYFGGPSRADAVSTHSSVDSSFEEFTSPIESKVFAEDTCDVNTCLNNGKCRSTIRGSVCICGFGFRGTHCEEAYCPNRYCRYGGTCTISNGKQQCACAEGFSGHRCTTRVQKVKLGTRG